MARKKKHTANDGDTEEYTSSKRELSNLNTRSRGDSAREIGEIPEIFDLSRRAACLHDLRLYLSTYYPRKFFKPFSDDHKDFIDRLQACILDGGLVAVALPRGGGKTSICVCSIEWATLYGHRRYPVVVTSGSSASKKIRENIKTDFETNELLLEDFPEACYPIRKLERAARRAVSQTHNGELTRIQWGSGALVLPTIAGSVSSGAVIEVESLLSSTLRGKQYQRPDGEISRPDFVLCEDPQTRESAKSPDQCDKRESIIRGDVLGMAGPGVQIAGVVACTVIYQDDLSYRLLDRERNPEWHGIKRAMLSSFPDRIDLWDTYYEIRRQEMREDSSLNRSNEFYQSRRTDMDAGALVGDSHRYSVGEISAIQHAMNLYYASPRVFWAEYQNQPEQFNNKESIDLDRHAVGRKISSIPRGWSPQDCTRITAFIDVQQKLLFWLVAAWDPKFGGQVVDYGTWPSQTLSYFSADEARPTLADAYPGHDIPGCVYRGLSDLSRSILDRRYPIHESEQSLQVSRCLIDANWGKSKEAVYSFCKHSPWSRICLPSHGRGIGAGSKPMEAWATKQGEQTGPGWRLRRDEQQYVIIDVNHWKTQVADAILAIGRSGSLWLPEQKTITEHDLLIAHLCSEFRVPTSGYGRDIEEWRSRPNNSENHWFDCLVGSAAAASIDGLRVDAAIEAGDTSPKRAKQYRRVSASEMQRKARHFGPKGGG